MIIGTIPFDIETTDFAVNDQLTIGEIVSNWVRE